MSNKRKYDIGNGVVISDDGYYLTASWSESDSRCGHSVGIKRPPPKPGETVKALFSLCGQFFYLTDYTDPHGFWLGVKSWKSKEEMDAQQKPGIMGKEYAYIQRTDTGETYYRESMSFTFWSVKHEKKDRELPTSDEMVRDYLSIQQNRDREQEKRFNEAIAFTGRDLKWILDKIGPFVPFDPEPAPVVLT